VTKPPEETDTSKEEEVEEEIETPRPEEGDLLSREETQDLIARSEEDEEKPQEITQENGKETTESIEPMEPSDNLIDDNDEQQRDAADDNNNSRMLLSHDIGSFLCIF
jgi:hypothetical protein